MQLDRVAAELRPRSGWESVDLGVAMWQRWARSVYAAWSFTVLPICIVLLVVLRNVDLTPDADFTEPLAAFAAAVWWFTTVLPVLALLWWFTPLFQRVAIHVLSRGLFGDLPSLLDTLRAAPGLFGRHLVLGLIAHRLNIKRTLIQPVAQLEDLRGPERSKRERLLGSRMGGDAWLSSLIAFAFLFVFSIAGIVLLVRFLPAELLPDFEPIEAGDLLHFDAGWLTHAARALFVAAYCVVAPIDAAIGFGLYVNRRTHLEGWDVEVAFRRAGERIQHLARSKRVGAAALFVAFALVGAARAQTSEPTGVQIDQAAEQVLESDDFGSRREVESWRFDWKWESSPKPSDDKSSFNFDAFGVLATLFEVVLWTLVIAAIVFIVVIVAKRVGWLEIRNRSKTAAPERPTHLFGLDLRPESLPTDVPAAVRALWARGEAVAALGLLYRAAISRLVERDGLELETSDTESDCLRRARALPDAARSDYFGSVTRAWQTCAYSTTRPPDELVERLCVDWTQRFETVAA